jgi:hypothetical protein
MEFTNFGSKRNKLYVNGNGTIAGCRISAFGDLLIPKSPNLKIRNFEIIPSGT